MTPRRLALIPKEPDRWISARPQRRGRAGKRSHMRRLQRHGRHTCDGTLTGFALANPKLFGEREEARQMLDHQPANRPAPGTVIVTDKGLAARS